MPGGRLSIQTWLHPNPLGRWITFPLTLDGSHTLQIVLDPGSPVSAISPHAESDLASRNLLLPGRTHRSYRLTGLTTQGQPLPDMDVRILPRLTRLQIDGLVGLDYLFQFRSICFYTATFQLVLEYP